MAADGCEQQFDGENRLTAVTKNSSETARFWYDASGARVKTVQVDRWQMIALRVKDSHGNDDLSYIYTDHLGSITNLTDNAGSVTDTRRYLPFGGWRTEPGSSATSRGFTGHRQNDDLGLIYMNARYYAPTLGRFLSADTLVPDPANPQSLNRYSYGLGNPLRFSDPSGHCGAEGNIIDSWNWDASKQTYVPTYSNTYQQCIDIRDQLQELYGWTVAGKWYLADVQKLQGAGQAVEGWFRNGGSLNSQEVVRAVFGGTNFQYADSLSVFRLGTGFHHVWGTTVVMLEHFSSDTLIHELGHVLDNVISGKTSFGGSAVWGGGMSDMFAKFSGTLLSAKF